MGLEVYMRIMWLAVFLSILVNQIGTCPFLFFYWVKMCLPGDHWLLPQFPWEKNIGLSLPWQSVTTSFDNIIINWQGFSIWMRFSRKQSSSCWGTPFFGPPIAGDSDQSPNGTCACCIAAPGAEAREGWKGTALGTWTRALALGSMALGLHSGAP